MNWLADPSSHRGGSRSILLALVALAMLTGCGEGSVSSTTPTASSTRSTSATTRSGRATRAPPALYGCRAKGARWSSLTVGRGASRLQAAVLGDGPVGVALANDSGNQPCDWVSFADALADRGLRVATFSYASVGNPSEVKAVAGALRAQGARRVIAIGASVGGRAVVELAAMRSPGVDAVASLSAERQIGASYPDILPDARHVHLPSLYVGSRKDGYTLFGKETVQLHDATPARIDELLLVPGSDHGVDLLAGPNGKRVRAAIFGFISRTVDVRP
jgi:hypothetical protein